MRLRVFALAGLLMLGCQRVPPPQKGGGAGVALGGLAKPAPAAQTTATLAQPENPAATSSQTVERTETRQEAAPLPVVRVTETPTPAGIVRVTEQYGPPVVLTQTVSEKTGTVLGASHQDKAREIAATLAGSSGIRIAGVVFLVFALACFHPVVRTVVGGGKTIPALAAVAGVVLVFGPGVFAGHETLVLVLTAAGLLVAFLVVRLSHKEGQQDARAKKV